MLSFWYCEECETVGVVKTTTDAGVLEVAQAIADNHKELSAECTRVFGSGRTLNLEVLLWEQVPNWAVKPLANLIAQK